MPEQAPAVGVSISGLTLRPDYLSPEEHDELLAAADQQPWLTVLPRRVQHYGYRYDYKARKVDADLYLGPLPNWAQGLAQRLTTEGWFPESPDQLIVNEYQPGQGIKQHVDCVPCFAGTIASVSLGSTCVLQFAHAPTAQKVDFLIEPRSLVVMQDEARYRWTHAVPARQSDKVDGKTYLRSRRVSLTFRKVLLPAAGL
jgi:alkylated DNA repair dioxygenase AlkB